MKTQRMKLDYNNLLRQIDEFICDRESDVAELTIFGIETGLNLLTGYMRKIGERALEINDEVLIGLLVDLHILVEKNEDGEGKEA